VAEANHGHRWVAIHQATSEVVVPVSTDTGLFERIYEIKAGEEAAAKAAVLIADPPGQARGVAVRR
jgi:hypothetical protein